MIPMVLMAIFMGVFPQFFLSRMEPSVFQFLSYMDKNITITQNDVVVDEPMRGEALPQGPILEISVEDAK